MEDFSHRKAREGVRTGGTEEAREGIGGVAILENKLNHESRYISNSEVNLNAEPNIEDFRNELAELKTQVQTLRDELADIKCLYEKRAYDSSDVAAKHFLQDRDQGIPATLGQGAAQAAAESEYPIDGYAGAEYRIRFKSSTGSIKYEAIENPLLGQPGRSLTSEKWLIATENANSKEDSGLSTNVWTITIADRDLIACLKEALKSYIDHTGRKAWETSQITLNSAFNPLVLNWRRILEVYKSMSDSPHREETIFFRLRTLMEHLRYMYPSVIKIQESWESSPDIEWKDIGILFTPGTLIVANWTEAGSREVRKAPQVFKVAYISHKEGRFSVTAWLWDWNGKDLTRTMYELFIHSYEESMRINDLPFYPVEFFMNEASQQGIAAIRSSEQYLSRKDLFIKYTFGRKGLQAPLRYAGDVLARQFIDAPIHRLFLESEKEVAVQKFIKIDEEIVLDTQNYVRKGGSQRYLGSHFPINNSKICTCSLCEDTESKEWARAMKARKQAEPSINDLLLAPRVFGYALTRKMWCQFALAKIETVIIAEDEGFGKELILPEEIHRDENDDIKHMVKYHMNVMSKPAEERIGDTIGGKGESLILLFHGHSGTGKTLYAESLAKWSGKALLKVGTSDIGQDLSKAETKLKEIFELAEAWNVVLLIDEADVLLDARGGSNEGALTKNALVSVLLREVEYFKGVLIMTTNRVVAFDPAILSRIHHAVNFTALTQNLQNAVWKLWLDRLEEKRLCIAEDKINAWVEGLRKKGKNGGYPLNGREIRNILILAQTLAFREEGESRITLDHINRAYHYKVDFRQDTESQRQAGVMLLAHKLGPGNSG